MSVAIIPNHSTRAIAKVGWLNVRKSSVGPMFCFKRKLSSIRLVLVLGLAGWCSVPAQSRDLGQLGPVYPIKEPDLLAHITATLKAKQESGELAQLADAIKARAIDKIKHPHPIENVSRTTQARTRYFDPSITVDSNVVGAKGKILIAAGTRKNPLDTVSMTRQLLFFDARDTAQVRYAKTMIDRLGQGIKPILVGGSYLDLMASWRTAVFYDQKGALVTKLGIEDVPALVYQEGKRLRIDEVVIR